MSETGRLVNEAREGGYAIGAFNVHNPETAQALLIAAERAGAPVILQLGGALLPHLGLEGAYEMTLRQAEQSGAVRAIHLDHGTEDEALEAIRLGFDSVMFDGSRLPFEENIRATRRIVSVAHDFGVLVEAELGRIPEAGARVDWESYLTDVEEAERFVAETGVDLLAISIGVVHGVAAGEPQPLAIGLAEKIRDVTGIPLVLHGASGIPDEAVRESIAAGVHKVNADTDLRLAFRRGIEEVWSHGDQQLEKALSRGREYMAEAAAAKMTAYGCAGRAHATLVGTGVAGRKW